MHEPHDLRPAWIRRTPARLGLVSAVAAIFTSGVITAIALRPAAPPVIKVSQPRAEAPVNQTTVLPFAVPSIVVMPAAVPVAPPAPEPEIVEPPAPRALVPTVNPNCVVNLGEDDPTCMWDDGFPAMSSDGTLIAIKTIPDDGGRGYPGMSIELVDVATSRIIKSMLVLSPDEYVEPEDASWPKLRAKIVKRAAAAQRTLDAKQFRALGRFDQSEIGPDPTFDGDMFDGDNLVTADKALRAERSGDAVRLIDTATHTVIWQQRFPVEAAYPAAKNPSSDGEGCYPSSTRTVGLAWDAPTRTLLATPSYASGPCYCGDEVVYRVFRL